MIMSEEALETIMESREELMISPVGDSMPTQRIAHFLQPSVVSNEEPGTEILSSSSSSSLLPPTFEPEKWPLTVKFTGWPSPPTKWIQWLDSMSSSFESVWRKAGIFEAIMSTKCHVLKNINLVFGIAERWCSQANTFVFPWGESSITLEDIMFLGGYPVLGDSVFKPLETRELKEVEEKLIRARKQNKPHSIHKWMSVFMNSGNELEHEAFLALWLCLFVFPGRSSTMKPFVFPIAIHLARGNAIALAPVVLASIYKDLSMLRQKIVDLNQSRLDGDLKHFELVLLSPFYLVQVWMWERFLVLQPNPKPINNGDTLLSRWHQVKALKIDNVRSVLESSMEEFIWRPYARFGGNKSKSFYADKSFCVLLDDDTLDKEIESYIICMRVSELVGFDCIEQYLPHRVAMQFGMDQDIPGSVARINDNREIAWSHYIRPIMDNNVYFPSRFFEADVTTRYVEWWKKSVLGHHQDPVCVSSLGNGHANLPCVDPILSDVPGGTRDSVKNLVKRKRSSESRKKRHNYNDADDVPTGFCLKCKKELLRNSYDRHSGNDEADPNRVPPPTTSAADDEIQGSMAIRVEKLQQNANVDVAREPKRAKKDAKNDDLSSFAATSMAGLGEANKEDGDDDANGGVEQESSVAHHNHKVNVCCGERENKSRNKVDILIMDIDSRISRLESVLKISIPNSKN